MVDFENDPVAAGFSRWRGTGSWEDLNFPTAKIGYAIMTRISQRENALS